MEILDLGTVVNCQDGQNYSCQIKKLGCKNLPSVLNLQEIIYNNLSDKQLFMPLTYEEFAVILEGQGILLGIFAADNLIGFGSVLFPEDREDNLGRDLGLVGQELHQVAHIETIAVHPAYRGNRLQNRIAHILKNTIQDVSGWRYLCCTISPYNPASIKSMLGIEMVIVGLKAKYNGQLRYLLCFDRLNPIDKETADTFAVGQLDFNRQRSLLKTGYCGLKLANEQILFSKIKRA